VRRAAKRDTVEPGIVWVFELAGASVWRLNDPNLPDLIVGWRGHCYPIEVKTHRAKVRPGQDEAFRLWRGTPVRVVRTTEEATALLRQWEAAQAVWDARLHAHGAPPLETPQRAPEGPP